ncbi:hypothetical protein OH492_16520 [Vibrio chagasii]|nr:hypothetical protein [Vibrio chagasii]
MGKPPKSQWYSILVIGIMKDEDAGISFGDSHKKSSSLRPRILICGMPNLGWC